MDNINLIAGENLKAGTLVYVKEKKLKVYAVRQKRWKTKNRIIQGIIKKDVLKGKEVSLLRQGFKFLSS